MHTELLTNGDGQRTQVGPDPLDYVLRYAACDYDCYHQGRYIGSRATLPNAVAAVAEQQAKAAHHPQSAPTTDHPIAIYQDELHAIAARLHALVGQLALQPTEHTLSRAQRTMAQIRVANALRSVQDAEHSFALARRTPAEDAPLDAAA